MIRTTFGLAAILLAGVSAPALADDYKGPPTPCDGALTAADFAPLLVGNATVNHYSMGQTMRGQGCEMGVALGKDFAFVDIARKPMSVEGFKSLVSTSGHKPRPIPGVADEAFDVGTGDSNIPDAVSTEVYVRKGGEACLASLHRSKGAGEKAVKPADNAAIATELAGLCGKLLAKPPPG